MDERSRSDATLEPMTLAVAATFTAQMVERPLAFWLEELDIPARLAFAPYNQPFQELLDPVSLLSTNRHGANIVLIRLQDWESAEGDADVQQKASELVSAIGLAAGRLSVPFLVVFCPASPQAISDRARSDLFTQVEETAAAGLRQIPGVDALSSAELMAAYPLQAFHDPQGDQAAHIPYTPRFFTALGTVIARWLYARADITLKAIVVDCDDTLWTGVCGEDGPDGVRLDAARLAIQDYLVGLHDKGVLVCLCSRNNEADVRATFDVRSKEMPLKWEHIASARFSWQPKSDSLRAMAAALHLSPDACVFIDNDPIECAEMQANCPEVLTIPLPGDLETVPRFLRNLWMFDRRLVTDEARGRTAFYRQDIARAQMREQAPSLAEFLARLNLKIHFADLTPDRRARASELTQRTNQFNLTTLRRSEGDIDALHQSGTSCMLVQVKDRFGDYGVVGLILFNASADALVVDTFLLSCRALGRGVEHRMLKKLGDTAIARGLERVDLPFASSGRNQPILEFLKGVAGPFEEPLAAGATFRMPAGAAAEVRYRPGGDRVEQAARAQRVSGPVESAPKDARAKAAMLIAIARDMNDLDQIAAQVTARARARPDVGSEYVAPRTPAEGAIAAILAEVLGIDRVGINDNFFKLGGHSLLAMQVLFRVREACQVELPARLLYSSAFTAADLAARVVDLQLAAARPPRIAALLEQLDKLSDDEVRAILAREAEASRQAAK